MSNSPPIGAFDQSDDTGVVTETVACLEDELYVAVIVDPPAAMPVTVITAEVCPAGTVTVAGTVAFVTSELLSETTAAALGAELSVTRSDPTPFDAIARTDGARDPTVGFTGVVPSVVNWMFGFSSTLLLYSVADNRRLINLIVSPAVTVTSSSYGYTVSSVISCEKISTPLC